MRWLVILPVLSFLIAVVAYVGLAPTEGESTLGSQGGNSGGAPVVVSQPPSTTGSNGASGGPTSGVSNRPPTPLPDRTDCASIKGTDYHSEAEREWYIESCVPKAPPPPVVPAPNPPAIPGAEATGERWILVDIASQEITAMIGDKPLYTALATTGKEDWETPPGTYNIIYRVANEIMTSASIGAEEEYVLTDVLYTQYFTNEGHAIHLNYWRPDYYFGEIPSSHGCVGIRLADAEFFWNFARSGTRVTIV